MSIQVPVFRDENTLDPVEAEKDILQSEDQEDVSKDVPKPWHIYMDAMGFGMGLSCLQITFQACNLEEAETLYDQVCASLLRNTTYFYWDYNYVLQSAFAQVKSAKEGQA